jgi:hypothetical protein
VTYSNNSTKSRYNEAVDQGGTFTILVELLKGCSTKLKLELGYPPLPPVTQIPVHSNFSFVFLSRFLLSFSASFPLIHPHRRVTAIRPQARTHHTCCATACLALPRMLPCGSGPDAHAPQPCARSVPRGTPRPHNPATREPPPAPQACTPAQAAQAQARGPDTVGSDLASGATFSPARVGEAPTWELRPRAPPPALRACTQAPAPAT